eukprot:GHVH01011951.1.p1 GENE.GHVH01011951.1~~GHVH01011951.1.p1  ORF type:complete len:115 (+),score=13.59 GHVH01011951.1:45-389(+)
MRGKGLTVAAVGAITWLVAIQKFLKKGEDGRSKLSFLYAVTILLGSVLIAVGLIFATGPFLPAVSRKSRAEATWWDEYITNQHPLTTPVASTEQHLSYLYSECIGDVPSNDKHK